MINVQKAVPIHLIIQKRQCRGRSQELAGFLSLGTLKESVCSVHLVAVAKDESVQNYRVVKGGKDIWRPSCSIPLLKCTHLYQNCLRPHPDGFLISSILEAPKASEQLVPVLRQTHSKKKEVFLYVQREPPVLQCVHIAFGPVTGHHCKEPVCPFCIQVLQVYLHTYQIPLSFLFSRLKSLSSFTQVIHEVL